MDQAGGRQQRLELRLALFIVRMRFWTAIWWQDGDGSFPNHIFITARFVVDVSDEILAAEKVPVDPPRFCHCEFALPVSG